jgi:tRNA threonylcarbamoyladenosine biosynthesis protein TsaE
MKKQLTVTNPQQTEAIAQKIGARLKGGEVIELVSDLGGGKTTFTRGLVKGAGSLDRVASPTFTISKVYKGKSLEVHHFDFYRLADAGLMAHEVHDVIGEPDIVVVIEWGDVVAHVLPEDRLTIRLKRTGDESRELELETPDSLRYLVEEL